MGLGLQLPRGLQGLLCCAPLWWLLPCSCSAGLGASADLGAASSDFGHFPASPATQNTPLLCSAPVPAARATSGGGEARCAAPCCATLCMPWLRTVFCLASVTRLHARRTPNTFVSPPPLPVPSPQPPLRHRRPLHQLRLAGAAHLWRGLAQQPPRLPLLGAPRPGGLAGGWAGGCRTVALATGGGGGGTRARVHCPQGGIAGRGPRHGREGTLGDFGRGRSADWHFVPLRAPLAWQVDIAWVAIRAFEVGGTAALLLLLLLLLRAATPAVVAARTRTRLPKSKAVSPTSLLPPPPPAGPGPCLGHPPAQRGTEAAHGGGQGQGQGPECRWREGGGNRARRRRRHRRRGGGRGGASARGQSCLRARRTAQPVAAWPCLPPGREAGSPALTSGLRAQQTLSPAAAAPAGIHTNSSRPAAWLHSPLQRPNLSAPYSLGPP